jgi:D-alanyl-D-alanine dipeptidase
MQISYKLKLIAAIGLGVVFSFQNSLRAQDLKLRPKNKTYWQEVQADSLKQMIELKSLVPGIVYDLRYATRNNFTKKQLYKSGTESFMRLEPARGLQKVQQELKAKGYGLKIFDAYRPYSITKKMWDLIHDERYVANPAKGSGHNRGLAVDLTIISLASREELNMGTSFDNFTDSAHHDFKNLPEKVLQNRTLLKQVMEKFGFKALDTEWWHYSWPNDKNYEVLDMSFSQLGNVKKLKQRTN